MKRIKNQNEIDKNPEKYLNKKKDHRFIFFTSWTDKPMNPKVKRGFKIAGLVALPVLAIALGTTLGVLTSLNNQNDKNQLVNQIIVNKYISKRKVYLLSEDGLVIPLTVSIDKKENVYEEMLDVITLMKVSTRLSNDNTNVHGFIPDETKVNSLEIKDGELVIDFSKEFLDYTETNEKCMFDAIKSTLLSFDGIEKVIISVDGTPLTYAPKTKVPFTSTRTPINMISYSASDVIGKEVVTLFYKRSYSLKNSYLVPISFYTDSLATDNQTYANSLSKALPSNMLLSNLEIYNQICHKQKENDKFVLEVNNTALVEENLVNKDLYDVVMLSLEFMNKETKVTFEIEGESLQVDQVYDEESQEVSSIYYNEIEI